MRARNITLGILSPFSCAVAAAWLVTACGGGAPPPPTTGPSTGRHVVEPNAPSSGPRPTGGSSDGTTCEEARDQNNEEIAIGSSSGPDLSVKELGAVLNDGKFLDACQVPNDTKVNVCAAVKNGQVIGVTIATLPSDPELEQCIAKQVRGLSFPSNPKLDIVRTEF
ncbi:MAG: hypothetical protein HY898_09710 [Deltaproteobacteria bacterium]|nr:hypothetical protein [Deltaproteobacteria bacterium]